MTLHHYRETDSLYIELSNAPSVCSNEVSPDVVLDFGEEGQIVGIDIDHASRPVDLTRLEAISLPLQTLAVA
jgi:uncharacterized protein YuzE